MEQMKVFVSHSSKHAEIAKCLASSLTALALPGTLDVQISENMPGGTEWRKWIETKVRTADVFVLLYPHASMEMGWCNYELGRFYETGGPVVCIKNTDIVKPPPTFENYQAFSGDRKGLMQFMRELFADNTLTKRETLLNAEVGHFASPAFNSAGEAAEKLARMFGEARVREQLYERRVAISVRYDDKHHFDGEHSMIEANAETLSWLGLGQLDKNRWATLRESQDASYEWPGELEQAIASITDGVLPPALSPFRNGSGIYLPVITKSQTVDDVLREVVLIFVAVPEPQLQPLFDWPLPQSMPREFGQLILLFRMIFRARWDTLEPRYQEARFRSPTPQRCLEIAQRVTAEYGLMNEAGERAGLSGMDAFYAIFDPSLHAELSGALDEWLSLVRSLKATTALDDDSLSRALMALRTNNARWLALAGRQFTLKIAGFCQAFRTGAAAGAAVGPAPDTHAEPGPAGQQPGGPPH